MSHDINASWDTLLDQAKSTGEDYFWKSQRVLKESGLAHTAADVIALASVMAMDFHSTSIGVAAQKIASGLELISTRYDYE